MAYRIELYAGVCFALLLAAAPAQADIFKSYTCDPSFNCTSGVATSGGNFDLTSNPGPVLGSGLELEISPADSLTVADIVNLNATYDMVTGGFAGSPRFTLFDDGTGSAYVYFGTPLGGGSFGNPNANGVFANTGNYADLLSSDLRVYSNGFGGDNSPNTGVTWATFVGLVGTTDLSFITLDLDSGSFAGAQEMLVSSFTVNDETDVAPAAVPEPLSLSLLGGGLGGLAFIRRRRAKARKD